MAGTAAMQPFSGATRGRTACSALGARFGGTTPASRPRDRHPDPVLVSQA
jgi:hypothetical protein